MDVIGQIHATTAFMLGDRNTVSSCIGGEKDLWPSWDSKPNSPINIS